MNKDDAQLSQNMLDDEYRRRPQTAMDIIESGTGSELSAEYSRAVGYLLFHLQRV